MTSHHFSIELAMEVGVSSAILYQNLKFWCLKNQANNKHFYEGKFWTYNSVEAFSVFFPYMTNYTIRKGLEDLEKAGYIVVGSFNQTAYDRTKWYSVIKNEPEENEKCIYRKLKMGLSKTENGFIKNSEPIPDIKPDENPNEKEKTIGDAASQQSPKHIENDSLDDSKQPPNKINSNSTDKTFQRKAQRVLTKLNTLGSKNYKPNSPGIKHIIARLKDGYSYQECIKVLETKIQDPWFKENLKFYRPSTLFCPKNFEDYLNEDPTQYKKQSSTNKPSNGSGYTGTRKYKEAKVVKNVFTPWED